jgi:hypothetical protein
MYFEVFGFDGQIFFDTGRNGDWKRRVGGCPASPRAPVNVGSLLETCTLWSSGSELSKSCLRFFDLGSYTSARRTGSITESGSSESKLSSSEVYSVGGVLQPPSAAEDDVSADVV